MKIVLKICKKIEQKTGFCILNIVLVAYMCLWFYIAYLISSNLSIASITAFVLGAIAIVSAMRKSDD